MDCIFFGVGYYAKTNMDGLIGRGFFPVCFMDNDSQKVGEGVGFEYDGQEHSVTTLPVRDALETYPESSILITTESDKWRQMTEELLEEGVPLDRILVPNSRFEYRRGCWDMGHTILFRDTVNTCCMGGGYWKKLETGMGSDFRSTLRRYGQLVSENIIKWRNGMPSVCDGCPNLRYGYWEKEPQIEVINFSSTRRGDFCNAKCSYCPQYPYPGEEAYRVRGEQVINIVQEFHRMHPDRKYRLIISAGEISVASFKDEIFRLIEKYGYDAHVFSNSIVYSEEIAEALGKGLISYTTTIDAMDSKKYAKIKGVDCLEQVLENVRRYAGSAKDTKQIQIKIVFAWDIIYDDTEEVFGIADFAEEVGAAFVLSCDKFKMDQRLPEKTMEMVCKVIDHAFLIGNAPIIMYDHFHEQDAEIMRKKVEADCHGS